VAKVVYIVLWPKVTRLSSDIVGLEQERTIGILWKNVLNTFNCCSDVALPLFQLFGKQWHYSVTGLADLLQFGPLLVPLSFAKIGWFISNWALYFLTALGWLKVTNLAELGHFCKKLGKFFVKHLVTVVVANMNVYWVLLLAAAVVALCRSLNSKLTKNHFDY